MARTRTYPPLNVFLNGRLVGQLSRQSSGAIDFQYKASWLDWPHALPVSLSMPLREDRFIGAPVIAVFDNLLPDNDSIRRKMAEQVGAAGTDAFSLLSAIGRDCVGALQFLPQPIEPAAAGIPQGQPLSNADIAKILDNLASAPLGLGRDEDFRISIAGAQEKTALLFHEGKWKKPIGASPTTHILKPQIGQLPNGIDLSHSVDNEYFCMKLIGALGLPCAEVDRIKFGGKYVLSVKRFDRLWTKDGRLLRLPQEDFCQALSIAPHKKYESDGGPSINGLLNLLKASDTPELDQDILLKSLVLFWLIGATDGHAKNFSIQLSSAGRFRLAPLYDVLSAEPSFMTSSIQRNKMKMALAVGNSRHYAIGSIRPRHFIETASLSGIPSQRLEKIFASLKEDLPKAQSAIIERLPRDFDPSVTQAIAEASTSRLRFL